MTGRLARLLQAYALRHAQTLVGSLGRLARQPFASFLTAAVIGIALALPLCLELLLQNLGTVTTAWNDAFEISVYLEKSVSPERVQSIQHELEARDDVAAVRLITPAQALAEFRANSGFGAALDALTDNPLPTTLIVTPSLAASTPEGTTALKTAIGAIAGVATAQLDAEWVQRLVAVVALLQRVVLLTTTLLAAGVLLIIGNTIRLDIVNRRAEIEVMKLVGATDRFARRPFLWTGFWYGLAGGLLALGIVAVAGWLLAGPVARLANLYGSSFRLNGLQWSTGGTAVLGAALLGWLGAWFTASHHIRAIEPR
jgi:cell division transport system permease protein